MVIIQDIKPKPFDSVYVDAPFDQALKELSGKGYRLVSLRENARLRIQKAKTPSFQTMKIGQEKKQSMSLKKNMFYS